MITLLCNFKKPKYHGKSKEQIEYLKVMFPVSLCRPRVNGLARGDKRGACFVVVPIKYSVGVRHALIAPQSYDVRVHVYTFLNIPAKTWKNVALENQ